MIKLAAWKWQIRNFVMRREESVFAEHWIADKILSLRGFLDICKPPWQEAEIVSTSLCKSQAGLLMWVVSCIYSRYENLNII